MRWMSLLVVLVFGTFLPQAEAQSCRRTSVSYGYSGYSFYQPYYQQQSYYSPSYQQNYYTPPTYYQQLVVPYAVAVDVIPSLYYSLDPGYGQKLRIDAETNQRVAVAKAEGDTMAAVLDKFALMMEKASTLSAKDRKDMFDMLNSIQQQQPQFQQKQLPPGPKGPVPPPVEKLPDPKTGANGNLNTIVAEAKLVTDAKCISCHDAGKKKGGLDMSNLQTLTAKQWMDSYARVSVRAPGWTMPLNREELADTEIMPFAKMVIALSR
jgi:hypothetical protein